MLKAIGNINDKDCEFEVQYEDESEPLLVKLYEDFENERSGNNIASAFGNDIKNIIIGSNVLETSFSQWVYKLK